MKRSTCNYSLANDITHFRNAKAAFSEAVQIEKGRTTISDITPIFIIGMPRSGTTLVEQILASHPKVYGGGELRHLAATVMSYFGSTHDSKFVVNVRKSSDKMFSDAANKYINLIRDNSKNASFITDKMPINFLLVGMVHRMMPEAKVVHCNRNPLDTCVSIYKTLFAEKGNYYAYDLNELGRYYNLYRDLMQHWQQVLPGFVYDVHYEKVVNDLEKQSRSLLEYCGLEWDKTCLEFYKNKRAVMTRSAPQVRKPIYRGSIQSWKRYEKQLEPLREIVSRHF